MPLIEWITIALLFGVVASMVAGIIARLLGAGYLGAFAWAGTAFVTITGLTVLFMQFAVEVINRA